MSYPLGLQSSLKARIQRVVADNDLVNTEHQQTDQSTPTSGRCFLCVKAIIGPGYQKAKNKLRNNVKTSCKDCKKIVCTTHADMTCLDCGHD